MKILKNNLQNKLNIRTEKNFPKEGIEFIDITPLVMEKDSFKEIKSLELKEREYLNKLDLLYEDRFKEVISLDTYKSLDIEILLAYTTFVNKSKLINKINIFFFIIFLSLRLNIH